METQKANEWTAVYFTVAMLSLMATFSVFHWVALALNRHLSKTDSRLILDALYIARGVRSILLRKVPSFASLGHIVICFVYLVINVTLCFYNLNLSLFGCAARLGWVATCNIALITVLALKNTPVAFLTAYSHERLKFVHQVAGYCTVIFSLLHAILFTAALSYVGSLTDLLEDANIMGIVAGLSMLIILGSALILRKRIYEAFYSIHVSLFILILITVGMHRPDINLKALIIIAFAASIWVSDRVIRFARITWYAFDNSSSVTPHAPGGIRIVLRRSPRRAIPGSHVFLWIPKIRAIETHPFTVVSTNPLELVISAHDGFTRDLFSYASKNPDTILRASIDGPYGSLPNFITFDQVILIAGGSGASFTLGVAANIIKKLGNSISRPVVNFIWVVREYESLTWYNKELEILYSSPLVLPTIHVTHLKATTYTTTSLSTTHNGCAVDDGKPHCGVCPKQNPSSEEKAVHNLDIEKSGNVSPAKSISPSRRPDINPGRPDIAVLIPNIVGSIESSKRTIVAVCGPEGLVLTTSSAVASILKVGNRNITLHCEQFRW